MPTYQYACTEPSCAHRFELVQSFTDPAASECPVCAAAVRKVYGSVGVVFKGSGFYRTDSRNAAGNGSSAATDGAKSDSKPGPKSEPKSTSKSEGSATKSDSSAGSTSSSGSSSAASPAAAAS